MTRYHQPTIKLLFTQLARIIVLQPELVATLLAESGYTVNSINRSSLKKQLLHAINYGEQSFLYRLSQLIVKHISEQQFLQPKTLEDSFSGDQLAQQAGQILGSANPVSAIAGAIGAIAQLIGNKQQNQMLNRQLQSEKIQAYLNAQQERARINAQAQEGRRKQQKKQYHIKTEITASLFLLIGLAIVFVI